MRGTPEQPGNSSGDEEGEGSKIRKRRRERERGGRVGPPARPQPQKCRLLQFKERKIIH